LIIVGPIGEFSVPLADDCEGVLVVRRRIDRLVEIAKLAISEDRVRRR
jgi:hypothetical protein